MTSKRETVLAALHAVLSIGPVLALRNAGLPEAVPATGLMILHDGVPGAPDVTLSPVAYHYEHRAQLDVFVEAAIDRDGLFDSVLSGIGTLIAADRTLGGLCDWIEAEAPDSGDLALDGAVGMKAAALTIVLHYSTNDPLN